MAAIAAGQAERTNTSCPPVVRLAGQDAHVEERPPSSMQRRDAEKHAQIDAWTLAPLAKARQTTGSHTYRALRTLLRHPQKGQEPRIRALSPRPGSPARATPPGRQGAPRS